MNIFITSRCPFQSARNLCNKHIVKMASESACMLLWPLKEIGLKLPKNKQGVEVRLSHRNHPATIWTCKSYENYCWHFNHFGAILEEYTRRYGKIHFAENYWQFIHENKYRLTFNKFALTPFPRCFSVFANELKELDTVEAYQKYYILDKSKFAKWPVERIPSWWPKIY